MVNGARATGMVVTSSESERDLSPSCWNSFRRDGIAATKSILATVADIAGDWVFYFNVSGYEDEAFDKFELPLLVFACVSSVMGVLLLISLFMDFRARRNSRRRRPTRKSFGIFVKRLLAVEIFVEDIPQFVLTAMVTAERGAISGFAVFNITTSAFNFILNVLDMIELSEEDE